MHRVKNEDGFTEVYTDNKFEEFAVEHVITPVIIAVLKMAAKITDRITIEKIDWEDNSEAN